MITTIASKQGKSPAQVILNWHLKRGHLIIPKTTKVERLAENHKVYDFSLGEDDYKQITGLDRNARLYNPKFFGSWGNVPYFD